jgi:hypothetical protein
MRLGTALHSPLASADNGGRGAVAPGATSGPIAKAMNAAATDERFAAILMGIHFISLNPWAKPMGFSIVIVRSFPLGAAPLRAFA